MRFALIDAEKAEFPVRTMCRLLDVSESGFFAWQGRPASQRQRYDMIYLAHIRTAFELSNRTYGSPRMHRELVDEGLPIGRRRTARLMRENGLAARQKRGFKRTTDSTHAWPVVPNLLDQDFAAEAPDQKWSADISYIWTAEGWLYLAVLIDLFSRRVVGWAVSDRLKKDLALRALRMALVTRHPPSGLIHHSDRGSQYCSIDYQAVLRVRPETLCRITEFSEHESNGRELDEGERVAVEVLPVLGQSAAAVEPGDGAFDHPTPGLDDEALHPIGSLDDLGLEIGQDAGQGAVKDRALIGAVGEQFPEKGKQTEQGRQQRETAVAILNVGGGDDAVQQQALRIDQNMPLLALDQLAGIEAVAVDASPPFSALFTL